MVFFLVAFFLILIFEKHFHFGSDKVIINYDDAKLTLDAKSIGLSRDDLPNTILSSNDDF